MSSNRTEDVFRLYATLAGDAAKTAAALRITEDEVKEMASAGAWDAKLASIIALKQSSAPGDVERMLNRAVSFAQGHRMRTQLERVLARLEVLTDDELDGVLCSTDVSKSGTITSKLNTRPFTDLAAAIAHANAVCAIALADTASDRAHRAEGGEAGGKVSVGSMHGAIAAAMSQLAGESAPKQLLTKAQDKAIAEAAQTT